MKNRCYETMTCVHIRDCRVRVWRKASELSVGPDLQVVNAIAAVQTVGELKTDTELIVAALEAALPDIEAIEVTDKAGDGGLVYPDWECPPHQHAELIRY